MSTLIAAIAANRAIGKDNQLLWKISEDQKRFKKVTIGRAVIMGRKTFESLKRPLVNRTNIVISKNNDYQVPQGVLLANSLENSFEIAKKYDANPFVIGGAKVYAEAMKYADFLDITHIDKEYHDADTFFPEINLEVWKITSQGDWMNNERNGLKHRFVKYARKNNQLLVK